DAPGPYGFSATSRGNGRVRPSRLPYSRSVSSHRGPLGPARNLDRLPTASRAAAPCPRGRLASGSFVSPIPIIVVADRALETVSVRPPTSANGPASPHRR